MKHLTHIMKEDINMELQTIPLTFRVWSTTECKFLENDELLDFSHGFINFYDKEMVMSGGRDFIISQDTGLKDESGKSIYIGDVLEDFDEAIFVVEYRSGELVGREIKSKKVFLLYRHWFAGHSKKWNYETPRIIGNIWQNPELLEEGE